MAVTKPFTVPSYLLSQNTINQRAKYVGDQNRLAAERGSRPQPAGMPTVPNVTPIAAPVPAGQIPANAYSNGWGGPAPGQPALPATPPLPRQPVSSYGVGRGGASAPPTGPSAPYGGGAGGGGGAGAGSPAPAATWGSGASVGSGGSSVPTAGIRAVAQALMNRANPQQAPAPARAPGSIAAPAAPFYGPPTASPTGGMDAYIRMYQGRRGGLPPLPEHIMGRLPDQDQVMRLLAQRAAPPATR